MKPRTQAGDETPQCLSAGNDLCGPVDSPGLCIELGGCPWRLRKATHSGGYAETLVHRGFAPAPHKLSPEGLSLKKDQRTETMCMRFCSRQASSIILAATTLTSSGALNSKDI